MPPNTRPPRLIAGRPTQAAGIDRGTGWLSRLVPARRGRMRNMLDLVRQIRDYNADASKAVSNILRLANSGWQVEVYKLDGKTPDEEGLEMVLDLINPRDPRVGLEYGGGLNVLLDMIHLTAATQGAAAMEIELERGLTDIADLVVINPWVIDFELDEARRWIPGIRHMGDFEPLHPLQFRYIPLDPEPGDPRGRSPFWAALDVVFFQMEVLRDLKAAAHFAGYPRIDIGVAWDAVYKQISEQRPDLLEPGKSEDLRAWLDLYLGDIQDIVENLNPDDAFIHYDSVAANYIVPTGKTIDVRELISTIDAQIISGLKQLPILLGRNEGATTTHATVQWQVYVKELETYQRVSSHLMSWALSFALRIWGRQGIVKFEYEQLRTSDRNQDAQAESIETQTRIAWRDAGWITNDEGALEMVGHEAVGEPIRYAPIEAPEDSGDSDDDSEDEGGENSARTHQRQSEDVRDLPFWQQSLYREAEDSMWRTYRDQIRGAWGRMDELILEEEAGRTPEIISTNGNGRSGADRHKPCEDC